MDNTIVNYSPTKSYKRQRYLSCPSINNQEVTVKFRQKLPRIHRQSFIDEFSCTHSNYSTLKSSNSEPTAHYLLHPDQIGVKAFDIWRPRRSSANGVEKDGAAQNLATRANCTINEDRVLTEMNVDRKRALESSKNDVALWYKLKSGQDNPFKSDLFVRVLYLIGSGAGVEDDDDDNNSSIHDQFLTEEQIRENQLKEQRVNVERLKHELASGDIQYHQSKSGTATPVELIYQSIPNLIKRNSFSSSKLEQVFKSNQMKSENKKNSIKNSNEDIIDSFLEPHNCINNKDNHKLTGREKSMFAPLTF